MAGLQEVIQYRRKVFIPMRVAESRPARLPKCYWIQQASFTAFWLEWQLLLSIALTADVLQQSPQYILYIPGLHKSAYSIQDTMTYSLNNDRTIDDWASEEPVYIL